MDIDRKTLWDLEITKMYNSNDLDTLRKELHRYLDILISIQEALVEEGIRLPKHEIYAECLLMKFYMHGISVYNIGKSFNIESDFFDNKKNQFIDVSSLMTIVRAQLEALLMYNHLHINSNDEDEQKLRFYGWIINALIQRKKVFGEEEYTTKEYDDIAIKEIEADIKKLKPFQELTPVQQNKLLEEGSARFCNNNRLSKTWKKIIEDSGFPDKGIISSAYYVLSAYAHSEGIVVLQLKESGILIDNEHNYNSIFIYSHYSLIMTCVLIKNIVGKYKCVSKKYEEKIMEKDRFKIDFYSKLALRKTPK